MAEKAPWEKEEVPPWETVAPTPGPVPRPMTNAELEAANPPITAEGLGRGALETLPILGSIGGGLLGSSAGPIGTIGGSGLGAMAGKSLEMAGKKAFFDEGPQTRMEALKEIGTEGLYGGLSEIGGQAAGKVIGKAIEAAPKALTKLGSALTGISEKEISTYATRADKVKQLAKETDASVIEAADQIRKQFNTDIDVTRRALNQEISSTLQGSSKTIDSVPVVEALQNYKARLNPKLSSDQIGQIDAIIGKIKSVGEKTTPFQMGGKIPNQLTVSEAHQIKNYLQDIASTSYRNGQIFQIGTEAANAAKNGAATVRKLINEAEPAVAKANESLAKLHTIEDAMNINLLKVGGPEAALMTAGTAGNVRNVKALQDLGEMTGTDMLSQAENLAAMRTFTNPPLLPMDTTGKSATRMGAAAAVGALGGGPVGSVIGGALSSPLVLKSAIETGRAIAPAAKAAAKAIPSEPTREMLYKGLMQKYFEAPSDKVKETPVKNKQDTSAILEKLKGSPYEQVLRRSLENGGEQSFAAANYVLKNRDQNYRDLFNEIEA